MPSKSDKLTPKQGKFVANVKKAVKKNGMPTTQTFNEAALQAYDVSSAKGASAIAGQLLSLPKIREALGFEDEETKGFITQTLLDNVRGQNSIWPKDKDLARDAIKICARLCFPEKSIVMTEPAEYANRSTAELEFKAEHGRWLEEPAGDDDKGSLQ